MDEKQSLLANQQGGYSQQPPSYGQPPPPQAMPPSAPPMYDGQPQQQYHHQAFPPAQPPPPDPGYQYQQQPVAVPAPTMTTHNTAVIVNNPSNVVLGEAPMQMTCPHCRATVMTVVSYEPGLMTWGVMLILFVLGFFICCWIPLFINSLKDVVHTCPQCRYKIGDYKRLNM